MTVPTELLELRQKKNKTRPKFLRQDYHHRAKIRDEVWRKPKGRHSKMRQHKRGHRASVKVGYRNPAKVRGLHKSGAEFVYVNTLADINKIHPPHQIGILSANIGNKKRYEILKAAMEKKILFVNVDAAKFISDYETKIKAKAESKSETKPEIKSEVEAEPKSMTKVTKLKEVKLETKTEPKPKSTEVKK
ncbi:MAG: eL32 family ribosomal protein [Candidatus Nanoarchaeia archaeon]